MLHLNNENVITSELSKIGKVSLCVYTTHLLFIQHMKVLLINIPLHIVCNEIILFFSLVIISNIIIWLISKSPLLTKVLMGK